jgi:hypothetical protein
MKNKTLVEDRLDGASNFSPWKSKLLVTLEEDDLLDVTTKTLPATTTYIEKKIRKEEDKKGRRCQSKKNNHLLSKRSPLASYCQSEDNI